jgi:hypothetical protein
LSIRFHIELVEHSRSLTQPSWLPLLYWFNGTLAGLVFFVHGWWLLMPWGWVQANPHPGHLMVELRAVVDLAIGGGMLGGLCALCVRQCDLRWVVAAGFLQSSWVLAGIMGWLSQNVFQAGCDAALVFCLGLLLRHRPPDSDGVIRFLKTSQGWNLFFFVLFVLLTTVADAVLLPNAPPSKIAAADFVLGRFITHVHQAALIWFLLAWHDRWVPSGTRWVGHTVLALVPLFLVADILLKLAWSKGLMTLFAELEVGGRFDMQRTLEGGGVIVTPGVIAIIGACALASVAVYLLCVRLSRRMGWRISPVGIVMVAFVSWATLQAEQGLGLVMKSRAWRWWEAKAAPMRFTSFHPDPGLASFQVSFRNPIPALPAGVPKRDTAQPDVYVFVVETLRADAITKEVSPFLSRWRDEECQPFGETFAASNATHLSWFSLLSGRLPIFWDDARKVGQLSPLLATLKQCGYRLEVRAVSDLNYMEILHTNFGSGAQLDHLEFVEHEFPPHPAEDEIPMMARLQDAIRHSRPGGTFRFIALDAPHYPYRWPKTYTPPIADFDTNPLFPVHPSPDQVRRIRNRYLNSISWVDHEMAAFVSSLKSLGRYDDAVIIVTGDHGEEFQEHGNWFHCSALSPQQTHVPLLIKWPHAMGRGLAFTQASHLDIAPSLLELAGCPSEIWEDLPGHSLLHQGEHSIIMATQFASRDGEALTFRRGDTSASFGWPQVWVPGVPQTLWLERLSGIDLTTPSPTATGYATLIKQTFPKAYERVFSGFTPQ